ncbi:MAG TPA: TetR/AcrR family transcriptional regulator [Rhizomicrobium sp.]|nr:TetR/AcrR family transcriptional regulator [Rhizomicrobium sp.]
MTAEKPARSWNRRKQARPGEILEAALSVFAEKGYAAARMEDIAVKAGVTKGTIYLYFPSKEEVFKSLARQHVGDTLRDAIVQARDYQGSVRDFLAMMITIMSAKIESGHVAVLPKIIIAESGNFPELARFWREEVIDKALGMLSGVIASGQARGEVRADVLPEYVARLCVAPFVMSIIWRTVIAPTDKVPFDYRKFLSLHLDVLMRGLAPEGKQP